MTVRARQLLLALALAASGCDKLKIGGSAEGGSPSIIGDLFKPDFEGEITMKMTSASAKANAGPSSMVVSIKKPKYRIDMAASGSMILDLPTKKGWMLLHPQKMAMEIDLEKAKNMKGNIPGLPGMPKSAPTTVPSSPPKIEKTGKKETIAGYACDVWNITSEGKRSEVCMAEGLSWIDMSDLGMSSPEITVAAVASEGNRFPLRLIAFDTKGAEELRMEAQKIDKKTLPDTSFAPPANYSRLAMGGLPTIPTPAAKR